MGMSRYGCDYGLFILICRLCTVQECSGKISDDLMIRQDKPLDPDDRQMILRGDPARNPAEKTVEIMGLKP